MWLGWLAAAGCGGGGAHGLSWSAACCWQRVRDGRGTAKTKIVEKKHRSLIQPCG